MANKKVLNVMGTNEQSVKNHDREMVSRILAISRLPKDIFHNRVIGICEAILRGEKVTASEMNQMLTVCFRYYKHVSEKSKATYVDKADYDAAMVLFDWGTSIDLKRRSYEKKEVTNGRNY